MSLNYGCLNKLAQLRHHYTKIALSSILACMWPAGRSWESINPKPVDSVLSVLS